MKWLNVKKIQLDKFTVIHNGIDLTKFNNALPYKKQELASNIDEDIKIITMVARFSDQKDQPTLIRAMKNLNSDIHLILVGEGPLMEGCKKLALKLGLSDRVHFFGYRQDVERIMKTSDIIVLSSNWEGFGLAAVEGMAAGKPVIASNVDGLREVVGDAGIIFEKGNHDELSKIINELLLDKSLYEKIVERGLYRANDYDIENNVHALIKLYKND